MKIIYYYKTFRIENCNIYFGDCNLKGHYIISFEKDFQKDKIEKYMTDFEKQSSIII